MNRLVAAIQLATKAHAGQLDKVGQPFIGHPLRVMARGKTESEMIVGVLHDVIEDTSFTAADVILGTRLTGEEGVALLSVTRFQHQTYRQYIEYLGAPDYPGRDIALAVKRNDILDNADPSRGWGGVPLSRYRWAWSYLFPDEPLPLGLARGQEGHGHRGHKPHGNCCGEHFPVG